MNQWVPILVALICLSSPSLGRNWVGHYDQNNNGFEPYHTDHHGYKPHQDTDYHSSSEDFWDRDDDFTEHSEEYPVPGGYNNHHGIHGFNHNHDGFKNPTFNHHNHENHGFHENSGYGHHNYENHPFGHHDNPIFDHHGNEHIPNYHGRVNDKDGHDQKGENNKASDIPQNSDVNIDKANGHQRDDEKVGSPFDSLNSRPHDTGPSDPGSKDSASPVPVDLRNVNTERGHVADADRVVFPDSKQAPITSSPLGSSSHAQGVSTLVPAPPSLESSTFRPIPQASLPDPETKAPATTAPTLPLFDVVMCVRACPATSEYNPVCGSNNVTYNNPSILECTRNCGVNVSLARQARCPRPIPVPLIQLLMDSTNATTNFNTTTVNTVLLSSVSLTETPK